MLLTEFFAEFEWIAPAPEASSLDSAMRLAREHGLSFYDACYLELALRMGAGLASRDIRLMEVARAASVDVHDLR